MLEIPRNHPAQTRLLGGLPDQPSDSGGSTTIAAIYKDRWQIELFFKALKQNLKIKTFVGTSANALKVQIWTALIAMLILTAERAGGPGGRHGLARRTSRPRRGSTLDVVLEKVR